MNEWCRFKVRHEDSRVTTYTPWRCSKRHARDDLHECRGFLNYLSWRGGELVALSDVMRKEPHHCTAEMEWRNT